MTTKIILTAFVSTFIIHTSAFAQGALTPPGAPAPTMKTLAQIEPRTPISSVPFAITVPGSYYLTTNLTTTVSNAITISVSGVTLDLSGFTIASTVADAANGGTAILLATKFSDLTIFNGHIRGGVTNDGNNLYYGLGFSFGIKWVGVNSGNTRISGISVAGCLHHGIYLNIGDSTVVEACTVRTVGGVGIYASNIKTCAAVDCGGTAIYGDQVADSRGESAVLTGLVANTAVNCYGSTGSNTGLNANTALNCYGTSMSGNGRGMYAANASFCIGSCVGGTAIQATIATGCLATAGTNNITYKYNMP